MWIYAVYNDFIVVSHYLPPVDVCTACYISNPIKNGHKLVRDDCQDDDAVTSTLLAKNLSPTQLTVSALIYSVFPLQLDGLLCLLYS
jgi:hypothetical protein